MPLVDGAILILLGGFVLFGLWFGFIHTLGALIGTIGGVFVASRLFEPIAQWIHGIAGGSLNFERVVAFLLILTIVDRLIGLAFWFVEKMFNFLTIIPFLKTINRLLGGLLGFVEGVLVIGLTLYFASRYPFPPVGEYIASSGFATWLINAASVLVPLIPAAIRAIRTTTGV